MPRVGDLSKCKIYKITSLNNPEMVYYGHTCQPLSRRFATHKSSYNTSTSKIIIEKGDAIILLIEDYPCETENQATSREAFYVLNNPCVNKYIPGRTQQEYYEANKEKFKAHYENNKEEILIHKKEYRDSHKEHIQEYRDSHKEEKKEYNKQYCRKKKLEKNNI